MHPSPTPSSRHSRSDATAAQPVSSLFLALIAFVALCLTGTACFATTWAARMLSDWPETSVMHRRRSLLFGSNNGGGGRFAFTDSARSSSFSAVATASKGGVAAAVSSRLHAALPRCGDAIYANVLLGGASSSGDDDDDGGSLTAKTQRLLSAIESILEQEGQLNKKSAVAGEPPTNAAAAGDDDAAAAALVLPPSTWVLPSFAVRAATVERNKNLLPRFYDVHEAKMRQLRAAQNDGRPAPVTSIGALVGDMQRAMGFSRQMEEASRVNVTYARNTVDKLLYQLRNFEPLRRRGLEHRAKRSWNPVVGLLDDSKINAMVAKHSRRGAACPLASRKRLTIGISSVTRKTNYLHATMESLIGSLKRSGWLQHVTIVLLDADVPPGGGNFDLKAVRMAFAAELRSGALRIVTRDESSSGRSSDNHNADAGVGGEAHLPHPQMRRGVEALAHRWGDAPQRILWRSKQALDVAWLMDYVGARSVALSLGEADLKPVLQQLHSGEHHDPSEDMAKYALPTDTDLLNLEQNQEEQLARREQERNDNHRGPALLAAVRDPAVCPPLGGYFLMLEDDVEAARDFAPKLLAWLRESRTGRDTAWTVASYYNPWPVRDGERLPPFKFFGVIGQLFRQHDLPTIVEFLRKNFDQSPLDWLFVDLLKKFGGQMVCHSPSLFQHKGVVSSLEGKEQDGRAVDFQP